MIINLVQDSKLNDSDFFEVYIDKMINFLLKFKLKLKIENITF